MKTKAYLLILAVVISGCGSSTPSESDAKIALEKALEGEKTRFLQVISFIKTDGMSGEATSAYQMDFEARFKCTGNEGRYDESGCCYKTSTTWPMMGEVCNSWANIEDELEVSGSIVLLKKESGWSVMQGKPGKYSAPIYKNWSISAAKNKPESKIKSSETDHDKRVASKMESAAAAASANKTWTKDELMEHGKTVYATTCAACHQANGAGIPNVFPGLAGSPIATGDVAKHINVVVNGVSGTAMQAFGPQLNDADLAALVTYERNAWGNDTGDVVQPADIKAAR